MQEGPFNVLRHKDWDRAPKDPVSMIAIGNAAFAALSLQTSSLALLYATGLAVQIGISAVTSWALSALAPKPDMSGGVGRGLKTNIRDAASPHDFVYGKIRKGGTITYLEGEPSASNSYLSMIIVLAGHAVNSIGDIYINDELATINGSGFVTNDRWSVSSDSTPNKIQIFKYNGTQSTPSAPLQSHSEVVDADTNFVGNTMSYLYVRMKYSPEVFSGGIPTFTAVVEGKKVYDPRTATTAYSANAALCVRDYLIAQYGLDEDTINIDDTSFSVAANTSDEDVDLVDYWGSGSTPTEKRYEINGVLSAANTPNVNLQKMMTACAGTLFWGGGKWKLKVGDYIAPTLSLTLDDVRGPLNISTKTSRRDNFNTVRGTFVNHDPLYEEDGSPAPINWLLQDYPEIESATFIAEDNGVKIPLDLELPLTTSSSMAQRLAKMTLLRAREQITLSVDFSVAAFEAQVGEVIEFTAERYGWVNKEFEVVGWKFFISEEGDLRVNLSLRETSEAAFAWDADERQIIANNSNLPDYRVGVTVANLTAVNNGGRVSSDGTWWPRVRLSWDSSASGFVDSYDIRYKVNGEADTLFRYTSANQNSVTINDLSDGQTYYFEVRARTGAGYVGAWASTTLTIAADTTAPSAPTMIGAFGQIGQIEIRWTNPSDADFSYANVYRNIVDNFATATNFASIGGTRTIHQVVAGETRYYWVTAVDYSGNESGPSASGSATSQFVVQADVDIDEVLAGAVDVASFAAGIEPVTIATGSLPTVKSTETVFFDGNLYRWNGTSYDRSTLASDITGQLVEAQLAADSVNADAIIDGSVNTAKFATGLTPVEVLGALPSTGNFEGRQVYLTTDNKLYRHTGSPTNASGFTVETDGADIKATSITGGKIEAGAIGADQIAANEISVKHLAVTDWSNLVPDGTFNQVTSVDSWLVGSGNGSLSLGLGLNVGKYLLVLSKTDTVNTDATLQQNIPLKSSTLYRGETQFRLGTGQSAANGVWVRVLFYDNTDTPCSIPYYDIASNEAGSTAISTHSLNFTTPSDCVYCRIRVYNNCDEAGSGGIDVWFDSITLREMNAASLIVNGGIVAGKLDVGAVVAGSIAAGAVTAETLAIGDFTNYAGDSTFEAGTSNPWTINPLYGDISNIRGAQGSLQSLRIENTGGVQRDVAVLNRKVPVQEGDVIYIEVWVYAFGPYTGEGASRIRIGDQDNNILDSLSYTAANIPAQSSWQKLSKEYTVPTGVTNLQFRLQADIPSGTIHLDNIEIRKKTSGQLIVDGTIEAGQIKAGAIGTDQLAANAVTAKNIAVGDFTNYASGSDFSPDSDIPWDLVGKAGFVVQSTTTGVNGTLGRLALTPSASFSSAPLERQISVEPGDVIYMSLWAWKNAAYNGTSGSSKLRLANGATGALLAALPYGTTDLPLTTWTKLETSYTVPSGVSSLSFTLGRDNTAGTALIDEIEIRKKLAGNLIVDGTITANEIISDGITRQGVAGSSAVTNNSSTYTTIATFTISSMPTTSYLQGIFSLTLSTAPSNLPSNFEIQVVVNSTVVAQFISGSAAFLSDNNQRVVNPFTLQGAPAGNIVVTLRMRNMGGSGVQFSNISAVAAMR